MTDQAIARLKEDDEIAGKEGASEGKEEARDEHR